MQKVRFKQQQYLNDYVSTLISTVLTFQLGKISDVQLYNGENTKISCDKLPLDSELISEKWNHFNNSAANATDDKISGKVTGYILKGECTSGDEEMPIITMVKVANPVIEFKSNRTIVYKNTIDDGLDLITDSFFRLYLTTDFLVISQYLYAFNHSFEAVYDIEKTLSKVKNKAADIILATNSISDNDAFRGYISQYSSLRTFITLNDARVEKLKQPENRKHIANILKIQMNENGLFVISDIDKASLLIKYLCYKIFQEADTEDILEASTIIKINLL